MTGADFDIEQVLSQLKLDEKIDLLSGNDFWHINGVKRLNILPPRTSDGPTGLRGTKWFNSYPSNCFPCGTALGATWNKDLLKKAGRLMAQEARDKGVHIILGPTCNIQRSPLGGRGFESFSEDPVLSGYAASAIIQGIQNPKDNVVATIKHFVCNDQEDERKGININVTDRALREIYLKPFQLAIKEANPHAVMSSYNRLNGEHVSNSKKLLSDILRDEWKYDGTTMSDWFGTYNVNGSIENGLDIEMPGPAIFRTIPLVSHQIGCREINIQSVDDRVRNVLKLIKRTQKSNISYNAPEKFTVNERIRTTLKEIASESVVLLKNDLDILPLKKKDSIAVIGPLAKYASVSGGGSAALNATYTTNPFDSLAEYLGMEPKYALGSTVYKNTEPLGKRLKLPNGDVGFHACFYLEKPGTFSRTKFDEYDLDNSELILYDYKNPSLNGSPLYYIDIEGVFIPEETGTYEFGLVCLGTAKLYIDGKLVVSNLEDQKLGGSFFGNGTIEERGEIPLESGKHYTLTVEFGSAPTNTIKNPKKSTFGDGGGLIFGGQLKRDPLQEIQKAVEVAKNVDKAIVFVGLSPEWESEGFDRDNMDLPPYSNELVSAVVKANPNTIVVNHSGTPVAMPWAVDVPGLLQGWYLGNEAGNAIVDILYGVSNPSGKLSLSFPKQLSDNPAYLNYGSMKGEVLYGEDIFVGYRFYEKMKKTVSFPFGHGLSYTKFTMNLVSFELDEDTESIKVSLEIGNIGEHSGSEVVQFYVEPLEPTLTRPVKELAYFEKVYVEEGSKKMVSFSVNLNHACSYFDTYQQRWAREKGRYNALLGTSSNDIRIQKPFKLSKTKSWSGL